MHSRFDKSLCKDIITGGALPGLNLDRDNKAAMTCQVNSNSFLPPHKDRFIVLDSNAELMLSELVAGNSDVCLASLEKNFTGDVDLNAELKSSDLNSMWNLPPHAQQEVQCGLSSLTEAGHFLVNDSNCHQNVDLFHQIPYNNYEATLKDYLKAQQMFSTSPGVLTFDSGMRDKPKFYKEKMSMKAENILSSSLPRKFCANCGSVSTPSWRRCPKGKQLLCNACGLYQKLHDKPRPVCIQDDGSIRIQRTAIVDNNICVNCHTSDTPLWRRGLDGQPLCNACGLYFKQHKSYRPLDPSKKKTKRSLSGCRPMEFDNHHSNQYHSISAHESSHF